MPTDSLATRMTKATFDYWSNLSNSTSLAAKTGELAKAETPTTPSGYVSYYANVVQTVDSLVRPVIELANLTTDTTSKLVANGGKYLGTAGSLPVGLRGR